MANIAANKTSGGNNAFHNFNNDFAHIEDPNERRRLALAEIDKAPFGWYHVRAILVRYPAPSLPGTFVTRRPLLIASVCR